MGVGPHASTPSSSLHFIVRGSEAGRRWMESFEAGPGPGLIRDADAALDLLRRGHLEAGSAQLSEVARRLERCRSRQEPSARAVLDRWFWGVSAFGRYRRRELEAASDELARARRAVVRALEEERALLPLAWHCQELWLHDARIARNRRSWIEMESHIERVRRMMRNEVPLCRLRDETDIWVRDVADFYHRIPDLTEDERREIGPLLDGHALLESFESFVQRIYAPSHLLIPQP